MVVLSRAAEVVERSVYMELLKNSIALGYTPDILNGDLTKAQYLERLKEIRAEKGFALEIFGAAGNDARDQEAAPRIVVNLGRFFPGDLGGGKQRLYESNGTRYDVKTLPPMYSTYYLEIVMVGSTAKDIRFMQALIGASVANFSYVPHYDNPTKRFLVLHNGVRDETDTSTSVIRHVYSYQVPDLLELEPQGEGSVARIEEVKVNIDDDEFKVP